MVDRRWQVLGGRNDPATPPRRRKRQRVLRIAVIAYLAVYTVALVRRLHPGGATLLLFIGINVGVAWVLLRSLRRSRSFIGLSPEGMCVVDGGRSVCHAWERVGRARYDITRQAVIVPCGERTLRLPLGRYFSRSTNEADHCVQALNAYSRPAASAMPNTPGTSASDRTT